MAKSSDRGKHAPQNPLGIIALLIGIVELAFAYPVTKLQGLNQTLVIAFMVSFPFLLMLGFFLTVWFRPGHLYGPKDYTKDESFLEGIGKIPAMFTTKVIPQPAELQPSSERARGADDGRQPDD